MNKHITDPKGASMHLKNKLELARVISDDLGDAPKETGNDFMYCCPFHQEDTPSFGVHKTMQFWHCFGCKKSGDVVAWVQNYKTCTIEEAIHELASKYNIDISEYERPLTPEELETQRYIDIMNSVAKFCAKSIFDNKPILDWYMNETGFSLDQIADYDIGYSSSQDSIVNHIYSVNKTISQYDVDRLEFTNRYMWSDVIVYPIKDASGNTHKFHNRLINPPDGFAGKYIGNGSKHPLFSNKHMFGMQHLKKKLKETRGSIRVTEGQKGAVAADGLALLGSTFHIDQINNLKEYGVREVRLAFDGDRAGRDASTRMLDIYGSFDVMNLLLGRIPEGLQPDTVVKKLGVQALDKIFADAVLPIQFFIDDKRDGNGVIHTQDKFSIVKELKDHLLNISNVQLDITADYLSSILNVEIDNIKSYIADLRLTKSNLHNREVELSALQYVLLNPKYWATMRQMVTDAKAFTVLGYQYLYSALDSVHKKARDVGNAESVTPQAVKDEISILFPNQKEMPKVVDTILAANSKYEFNDALNKTTDLYRRRVGVEQSKMFISGLQDLGKTTGEIVSVYRRNLVTGLDVRKDEISLPNQLAKHLALELQERSLRKSSIVGHDFSNLVDVDDRKIAALTGLTLSLSGLQKQHQVIISANSGVGKSLIALEMAVALSICPKPEDQVPCIWIPLEMNATETLMRVVSIVSGVDNNKVQLMNLNTEESRKVRKAIEMVNSGKLYIKKPSNGDIDEIFSIIDEYKFKYGIEVSFLDYIQLITSGAADRGSSREEVIGRASKVLKNQVAEKLKICSVCIAQQNRKDFKAGEVSKMENIGGSYQIGQDADDFLTLAEKTKDQMEDEKFARGNRKCFIDKRRGGASDIMLDMMLDVSVKRDLRFIETISPSELLGLSMGTKRDN